MLQWLLTAFSGAAPRGLSSKWLCMAVLTVVSEPHRLVVLLGVIAAELKPKSKKFAESGCQCSHCLSSIDMHTDEWPSMIVKESQKVTMFIETGLQRPHGFWGLEARSRNQIKLLLFVHQNIVLYMMKTIATYGTEPTLSWLWLDWSPAASMTPIKSDTHIPNLTDATHIFTQMQHCAFSSERDQAELCWLHSTGHYVPHVWVSSLWSRTKTLSWLWLDSCSKHASHQIWHPHPKFDWSKSHFYTDATLCLQQWKGSSRIVLTTFNRPLCFSCMSELIMVQNQDLFELIVAWFLQQACLPSNLTPTSQIWLMQLPSAMKEIIQNYADYIHQATTCLMHKLMSPVCKHWSGNLPNDWRDQHVGVQVKKMKN